jgi:hypothetical protein
VIPLLLPLLLVLLLPASLGASLLSLDLDPKAQEVVYSGQEALHFSVSWSGGVKIGDLYLTTSPAPSGEGLLLTARVQDYGIFRLIYPVDDTFRTLIRGPLHLPYRYEVEQRERRKTVHRLTLYDQQRLHILYQKNTEPVRSYSIEGPAYNEFSSFFITRALNLLAKDIQTIPTFVDEKRHKVPVRILGRVNKRSLFGPVQTVQIQPTMNFKGLYDKDGDTVFWLTDDVCRIPVEISSKILIGSLVATLVDYSNPACPLYRIRP